MTARKNWRDLFFSCDAKLLKMTSEFGLLAILAIVSFLGLFFIVSNLVSWLLRVSSSSSYFGELAAFPCSSQMPPCSVVPFFIDSFSGRSNCEVVLISFYSSISMLSTCVFVIWGGMLLAWSILWGTSLVSSSTEAGSLAGKASSFFFVFVFFFFLGGRLSERSA